MKRYDLDMDYGHCGMAENVDGEWIHYEDHCEAMKRMAREPEGEACEALGYATRLAESLWRQYYKTDAPNWKPLDTVAGVLTQIDNMVSGMTRATPPAAMSAERDAGAKQVEPATGWTVDADANVALLMLDRLDVSGEDDARVDAIAATIRRLAAPTPGASPAAEYPAHPFAVVIDRTYEGEGPTLAVWNGENYSFSDGDCFEREADGTLDGYNAEWLTHYQLEKRLFSASASPASAQQDEREPVSGAEWLALAREARALKDARQIQAEGASTGALTDAARRLMLAADAVDLGRSIHNARKSDDKIEGAVWNELMKASSEVRALLVSPAKENSK